MKKATLGLAILLLAGLVFWVGRPYYARHRERRLAAQAQSFMRQKEYSKAWVSARRVLQINPASGSGCRLMADLADLSHSPQSVVWRSRLAELEPTVENRVALASCALRFESPPYPLATKTLEAVAAAGGTNAAYHVACADRAIKLNQLAQAEAHFLEAGKLEPDNPLHRLNLNVLRLKSPDPKVAGAARSALEGFAGHPQYGLVALRSLATEGLSRKDFATAERFSKLALANSNSVFGDRVLHLTILREAGSPEFNAHLAALKTSAGTNVASVFELGAWMNGHGLSSEALGWLQGLAPGIRSAQPTPLLIADCCTTLKDWPALEKWLRDQKWAEQDFLRWAMLSRALRSMGETDMAAINWNKAVRAASEKTESLAALLGVAQSWGWRPEVEGLLWQASKQLPEERWALQSLERAYLESGNTPKLFEVYSAMNRGHPKDLTIKNNLAAISLLLKTNLVQAHELAADAYAKSPTNSAIISTYAFSLHLRGKTPEGLALLGNLPDADLQRPSLAAYYALLLSAAGETDKARKYLALAERAPLLPEEKALLGIPR
jgi:hypothetical protein